MYVLPCNKRVNFLTIKDKKYEKLDEYRKIHSETWPEIKKTISRHNIKNFSIYKKGTFLFGYFEYVGDNIKKDFEKMSLIPVYRK